MTEIIEIKPKNLNSDAYSAAQSLLSILIKSAKYSKDRLCCVVKSNGKISEIVNAVCRFKYTQCS